MYGLENLIVRRRVHRMVDERLHHLARIWTSVEYGRHRAAKRGQHARALINVNRLRARACRALAARPDTLKMMGAAFEDACQSLPPHLKSHESARNWHCSSFDPRVGENPM